MALKRTGGLECIAFSITLLGLLLAKPARAQLGTSLGAWNPLAGEFFCPSPVRPGCLAVLGLRVRVYSNLMEVLLCQLASLISAQSTVRDLCRSVVTAHRFSGHRTG